MWCSKPTERPLEASPADTDEKNHESISTVSAIVAAVFSDCDARRLAEDVSHVGAITTTLPSFVVEA